VSGASSRLASVTMALAPSSEGESLDIPFMKFWDYSCSFYGKRFEISFESRLYDYWCKL